MLKNNKLLIDENCPMCTLYGKCFTRWKWIDQDTIRSYQKADKSLIEKIDATKAKSEIAYYNPKSGHTYYGIDAMIRIISQQKVWVYKLLTFPLVYQVLKMLYFFISYNRKVIVLMKPKSGGRDCTPSLHLGYRWAYIILVSILTGFILNFFSLKITQYTGHSPFPPAFEYLIALGQLGWQGVVIQFFNKKQSLSYLGHISSVSLMGSLLLGLILGLHGIFVFPLILLVGLFFSIVGIMLMEHLRRCKLLGISIWMTVSWVVYRLVILVMYLFLLVK